MSIDSLLIEIRDALSDIAGSTKDISDGLWHNKESSFVCRVSHVLTCDLLDQDKLNCIRILYFKMAWPEKELTLDQKKLLDSIR